jgi:hypothetical protein
MITPPQFPAGSSTVTSSLSSLIIFLEICCALKTICPSFSFGIFSYTPVSTSLRALPLISYTSELESVKILLVPDSPSIVASLLATPVARGSQSLP